MKKTEKIILLSAILVQIIVLAIFSMNFYSHSISNNTANWGAVGDFFGGILSPILTFLLIILIIKEATENRLNFKENKALQLESQEQVENQIAILTPKPDLVYYISAIDSMVFATIENIGSAVAYDIKTKFEFDGGLTNSFGKEWIDRLSSLSYIPPKYKNGIFIAHVNINRQVIGFPPHKVTLTFSSSTKSFFSQTKEFYIDKNMLGTLFNSSEISAGLGKIEDAINQLKK